VTFSFPRTQPKTAAPLCRRENRWTGENAPCYLFDVTNEARLLVALARTAPPKAAARIRKALKSAGTVAGAARTMSVSKSLLYRLMSELGVSLERVVR
jgi:hypothetical protein